MSFRLVGDEAGLLGYWRFDEGGGTQVFDQTANAPHGTISGNAQWITSDAPIGQRPGIGRTSFQFQGRTVESGLASLLYYQQEQAQSGYDQTPKPMKQSARVLLAGATKKNGTNEPNYIGALDFAVSRDGFLAQIPDNINLGNNLEDNKNEILEQMRVLEIEETQLQERINDLSHIGIEGKLQASDDITSRNSFGSSVAISGDWALVGAYGKDNFTGAAYLFHLENGAWREKDKLQHLDKQLGDSFGNSVAISGDWALVGAYGKDNLTGAAYMFHLENGEWSHKHKLQLLDKQSGDSFGYSVAISGDWALVGAFNKGYGGAAYLFHLENGAWQQKHKLQALDKQSGDSFGFSVAISGDWALVGAYGKDSNTGAAYLFHLKNGGWSQKHKLQHLDKQSMDWFGSSVAISGDWALVGAYGKDSKTGAAYLFHLENGGCSQKHKLPLSDKQSGDDFGCSVAISGDWALVGSQGKYSVPGAAYLFHLENGAWQQKPKLQASDKHSGDKFGYSVAISEDCLLSGVSVRNSRPGAAYTFTYILPFLEARLQEIQAEIERLRQLLNQSPIPLPLLYLDPMGLTVSGGLLGFASTQDTPQLFDSATGQLALYFRGENDKFLAAYYDSNTVRAEYQLSATTGKLTLLARSPIGEINQTRITVADSSDPNNCRITIANDATGITETWNAVPRVVNKFADVLNGQAQDYNYEEQASTNKPAYLLQHGSLHFIAIPNNASGNVQNTTVTQPYSSALSCNWIADSPGKALSFGGNDYISVTTATELPKLDALDAKGDVTLEAWVDPSTINDEAQVIYHYSDNCKYALSLKKNDTNSYKVKAGVDNRSLLTVGTISKDNWHHLAVVFNQSYALQFDGRDYLDAGTDSTLNATEDLTIEVVLKVDDTNSGGILSKGVLKSGLAQEYVPYALSLENRKLVFTFENDEGQQQKIESSNSLNANSVYKIAITRQKHMETATSSDSTYGGLVSPDVGNFDNINTSTDLNSKSADVDKVIKADFVASKKRGKQLQGMQSSSNVPQSSNSRLPTGTQITQWIEVKIYINGTLDSNKALPTATCGRNSQPLEIGKVGNSYFKGSIAEVRLWNRALPQGEINQNVVGAEEGLLAWWRLEENEGNIAYDSKSNNHAQIKGAKWIKNPDPNGSSLVIYVNGISMATESTDAISWQTKQFALGALKSGSNFTKYFSGTLEEVRIWKVARTQEQIQDNLFTRLKGEKENLIANYTFDGEDSDRELLDSSLLSNHLPLSDGNSRPNFILSTAPISNDIAQVRSALAGIETQFHDTINSRPAVQEYSDLQYDIDGNLIAVMKRCYAFIKNSEWHLVTGYKVGNLITEWISQAQFDPQIIGFIEGAPPVPSENLTAGPSDNYRDVTSLEVVEAENVMYTFSNSKEEGSDQAIAAEGKVGASFDTRVLVAPFGFGISFKLRGEFKAGIGYESQSSKGWSSDQSFSFGRNVSKNTSVSLGGAWEDPNQILNSDLGRRYVPSNMGFALVQSETADVFALRLAHNGALVSLRFQPNPDIPKDVNLIPFPINPRYTKQGTLDGSVGYNRQGKVQDPDYPNATGYGEYSYFKPKEAYALKKRIKQEEEELKVYYRNFDTGVNKAVLSDAYQPGSDFSKQLENKFGLSIANTYSSSNSFPQDGNLPEKYAKRNLVNTYVWTADGGFYAESTEVTEVKQESISGTFSTSNLFGGGFDISIESPVIFETSFTAMNGGHLNVTKSKTQESQNSFRLDVTVNTPGDLQRYDGTGNPVYENNSPKIVEGKVDAYRFMTFYLEPVKENFEDLFNKIVDPIWLNQADHPNALAMRQAQQVEKTPPCWRVFHRVTFVSRILPEIPGPTAPPLEEAMQDANIESNWQLIQRLEPLVRHKTNNFAEFSAAVGKAVDTYLPELSRHKSEVISYMALYFGIEEAIL